MWYACPASHPTGRAARRRCPPSWPSGTAEAACLPQKWVYLSVLLDWSQTYSFIISPVYPWDTFNWSNSIWEVYSYYVLAVRMT